MKVVGKETSPQYIQQNELSFIPNNYQLEMDIAVPVNVVFYFFFFYTLAVSHSGRVT